MLWYKSWLETRWRFLIGLLLLMISACSSVLMYLGLAASVALSVAMLYAATRNIARQDF